MEPATKAFWGTTAIHTLDKWQADAKELIWPPIPKWKCIVDVNIPIAMALLLVSKTNSRYSTHWAVVATCVAADSSLAM